MPSILGWWAEIETESGQIQSSLKRTKMASNGSVSPAGGVASSTKRITINAVGIQTFSGVMGASIKKPTTQMSRGLEGSVSASVKKTIANVNGKQTFSGAIGAALKKATTIITGSQKQTGTITSTAKKTTAAMSGNSPISISYSAPFAAVPSGMITVRSAGSGNIGLNGSNLREGTAGASTFTYHAGILADVLSSAKFFTEVGAAATNSTNRGIGAGASNNNGSLMVFCYAIGNGGGAEIYTRIGTTWTSRATDSSVQIKALNDKIRLVPSVSAGVVTWTVYKNGVATSLTWADSTHLVDLPGTHPVIIFRHYDSSGTNYYSQGINYIAATEI